MKIELLKNESAGAFSAPDNSLFNTSICICFYTSLWLGVKRLNALAPPIPKDRRGTCT